MIIYILSFFKHLAQLSADIINGNNFMFAIQITSPLLLLLLPAQVKYKFNTQ